MIRKSGNRFSEKDHAPPKKSWSANRFNPKRLGSSGKPVGSVSRHHPFTDQNHGSIADDNASAIAAVFA
jgi:hypothetical protein